MGSERLLPPQLSLQDVLYDYRIALESREASLVGRKEVLGGKAKFGIFGDGKEIPQLAMARAFRRGDWRSGYYRDQTFMFALGLSTLKQFFAQLYADSDIHREPASGGRQMNCHYGTRFLNPDDSWKDQSAAFNSSADVSPTGGQMSRLVGLGYASKLYRDVPALQQWTGAKSFSSTGNEVAFGTIGNASASEGVFWESLNAIGVLQVPCVISVWDDDYGISVPNKFQIIKESISRILSGFNPENNAPGIQIFPVVGHDYAAMVRVYEHAATAARKHHQPSLIHVTHLTQPQGHSTSGSHERYKSKERLAYEESIDGLKVMRRWLEETGLVRPADLDAMQAQALVTVESARKQAWDEFQASLAGNQGKANAVLRQTAVDLDVPGLEAIAAQLATQQPKLNRNIPVAFVEALTVTRHLPASQRGALLDHYEDFVRTQQAAYSAHFFAETRSPLKAIPIAPIVTPSSVRVDGRQVIQRYFDLKLAQDPRIFIVGEDVGKLGGVNLEFDGLSDRHGDIRVTDTGIREATILGQGIGAAMRGLRPIVDIQYLDYLLYALQTLSDDLATVRYRSAGGQASPVIIRTKGHRLEGIWHTGSPMGMLLGAIRGVHLCVPRNCTQAVGMYETLLQGDDPGLVIEVLNGYRLKESIPDNIGSFRIPLGQCEVLSEGTDMTIVTYGANVAIVQRALPILLDLGISAELIDVQTLLPFDLDHQIARSIAKTHAVLFFDEDVPGGASAYMLQQVLEKQGAYDDLDAEPRTLTGMPHRSAYGSDGDYFSKPNHEDLVLTVYDMMHRRRPHSFPSIAKPRQMGSELH